MSRAAVIGRILCLSLVPGLFFGTVPALAQQPKPPMAVLKDRAVYDVRLAGAWHGRLWGGIFYLQMRPLKDPFTLDVTGFAVGFDRRAVGVQWLRWTAHAQKVGGRLYYTLVLRGRSPPPKGRKVEDTPERMFVRTEFSRGGLFVYAIDSSVLDRLARQGKIAGRKEKDSRDPVADLAKIDLAALVRMFGADSLFSEKIGPWHPTGLGERRLRSIELKGKLGPKPKAPKR